MPNDAELCARLRHDEPSDYRERYEQMLKWTGSAFLAGEPVDDEDGCKARLYSFLCATLGYFVAAEVTARNGHEAASRIESLTSDRWRDIADAPKDGTQFIAAYFYEERGEWIYDIASWHGDHACGVNDGSGPWTHFMVPEPPVGGGL